MASRRNFLVSMSREVIWAHRNRHRGDRTAVAMAVAMAASVGTREMMSMRRASGRELSLSSLFLVGRISVIGLERFEIAAMGFCQLLGFF